jgi:hypothetical protein
MLTACSAGGAHPNTDLGAADLGVGELEAHDGDMAGLPGEADMRAGDGSVAQNDLSGPGTLLVEDFCVADLGISYTRCYVTQQPIDGY